MTPPRARSAPDPDELLFRDQIAALLGILPNTWSSYVARDPALKDAAVYVGRTPRWPRRVVTAWQRVGQGVHAGVAEPGDTRARVVACSVCGAARGKGCQTRLGRACLSDHAERFRAAGLLPRRVRERRPRVV